MATRNHLVLFLNGKRREVHGGDCFLSLSDYLRYRCGLVGTKIVCSEGDCGSCTVLIGRPEGKSLLYRPVDSCIQWMFQLDGTHVISVEGLGGTPPEGEGKHGANADLTAVQQAMVNCHGSQCGFCTPGFVMAMTGICEAVQRPRPHRRRLASRPDRQPVPLHRLHADHQRRPGKSAAKKSPS